MCPPTGGTNHCAAGRFLTYELLRLTFGTDPNVEIIWDRRRPVDTQAIDAERRGRPPVEWKRLDYLFTSGKRPIRESQKPPS